MNITSKFGFFDQKPDGRVVHHYQFREADRTSRQPFDSGPEIEVLALDPLGIALANLAAVWGEVPFVSAPIVRQIPDHVERFKLDFEF